MSLFKTLLWLNHTWSTSKGKRRAINSGSTQPLLLLEWMTRVSPTNTLQTTRGTRGCRKSRGVDECPMHSNISLKSMINPCVIKKSAPNSQSWYTSSVISTSWKKSLLTRWIWLLVCLRMNKGFPMPAPTGLLTSCGRVARHRVCTVNGE